MYVIYSNISNVCTYIYIVIRNRYIYTKHHCIQLVYISYIMPRSSLKNVKNAKTPNNVANRNVHRAKSGRTHGEVMFGGYRQQRPVVVPPKATTSSSSRQKAASVYHDVKAAMKTRAQRKNHNKKRNKKKKKQNEALIEVPLDRASQSHHNYTIHT